jgi:hypothetical protein
MAERIDFTKIDRNDPRFFETDPDNPNTNISGSRFNPTDPTADVENPASASARYNQFLQTANIGDTFDFGDGTVNKFTGFNKMGTPIIQTIESPERANWRGTMSGATSFADAVGKLTGAGFSKQFAEYLTLKSGTGFMDQDTYLAANRGATAEAVGAMADGTPIYGYDADGEPVTSPTGDIVSTTSPSSTDGAANFSSGALNLPAGVKVVSTYTDPTTGDVTAVMSDGATKVLAKSGKQEAERKSAYDLLYSEFDALGVGALVPDLKSFIEEGISPAEFTLRLRQTDAYKKRFAANAQRINKGLRAISEAEYIAKEDAYQDIMRRYGLPETYYSRGEMGRQEGFEKLIASDVSDVELEDRISTAQKRVINANPEVAQALRTFYPGISQGDILAYTLDPSRAIEDIKRKSRVILPSPLAFQRC